jgi:hypothetical protein
MVDQWMKDQSTFEAGQGFTFIPKRSEVSFATTSLQNLRHDSANLKSRPAIAAQAKIQPGRKHENPLRSHRLRHGHI